jgi:hypothetical protein
LTCGGLECGSREQGENNQGTVNGVHTANWPACDLHNNSLSWGMNWIAIGNRAVGIPNAL